MRKNERETVRVEDLACSNMLMREALVDWSLRSLVESLTSLRDLQRVAAITIVAELGCIAH